jgi:hypothetical protein
MTYSSGESQDSVRIAFLLAALNDLDIQAADIGNTDINADMCEMVCFTAGDEFGAVNKGKIVIIVEALYGLKSSGTAWWAHLAEVLHDLGYKSSLANPDVQYCPEVKPYDNEYHSYVLVYVDDILSISHDVRIYSPCMSRHEGVNTSRGACLMH